MFGDQGPYDNYSTHAFEVLRDKERLGLQYLASFLPAEEIPDTWQQDYTARLARRAELEKDDYWHGKLLPVDPPAVAAIRYDIEPKYGKDDPSHIFHGASVTAIQRAIKAAQLEELPSDAIGRLEYVLAIQKERHEHGWRGQRGARSWVDLPKAPWAIPFGQKPKQLIEDGALF